MAGHRLDARDARHDHRVRGAPRVLADDHHAAVRARWFVPRAQPWPPGLREMLVDGWQGKTYHVEVTGDELRAAAFTLDVTYQISCER